MLDNTLQSEVLSEYQLCVDHRKKVWDELANKASNYVMGNQWTQSEKSAMEAKKRVPATFNMVLPAVDLIVGHWLQGRMDLVAKPVDEYGDVEIASIITACIKYIEHCNMMPMQDKYQFRSGVIRGIGVKEFWFDREKSIKGEIRVQNKPSGDYHIDPDTKQYDCSDSRYVFKTMWMSKNELIRIYGKKKAEEAWGRYGLYAAAKTIADLPEYEVAATWSDHGTNDYGNKSEGSTKTYGEGQTTFEISIDRGYDTKKRLVRVIERYEKVYEENEYFMYPGTGEMVSMNDMNEEVKKAIGNAVIKRTEHHIHLTSLIGDSTIGEDAALEATEFFQLFNFFFPYWDEGKYMGVVENLLYPQDEINQRHSTLVHVLSTLGARGFIYEDGALPEESESDLEERLSQTGYQMKTEKGALAEGRIKFQENLQVPATFERLEDREAYNIKYISGATDSIQGMTPRIQSGRAKDTEIAQAAVRLTPIIDNWKDSKILCGKALVWWIQNYYNDERVIRIMGEEHVQGEMTFELNKKAFGMIFNDIGVGEYDVTFAWEGLTKSERERQMFRLTDLANTVPAYAQPIADEVVLMSDIPNKWKLIQKFQQIQQQQAQAAQMAAGMPQQAGRPGSPGGARRIPQQLQ